MCASLHTSSLPKTPLYQMSAILGSVFAPWRNSFRFMVSLNTLLHLYNHQFPFIIIGTFISILGPLFLTLLPPLQRHFAHEKPVIFFSLVLGGIGPVLLVTVPPIRTRMGWKPAERVPTSYPGAFIRIVSYRMSRHASISPHVMRNNACHALCSLLLLSPLLCLNHDTDCFDFDSTQSPA